MEIPKWTKVRFGRNSRRSLATKIGISSHRRIKFSENLVTKLTKIGVIQNESVAFALKLLLSVVFLDFINKI